MPSTLALAVDFRLLVDKVVNSAKVLEFFNVNVPFHATLGLQVLQAQAGISRLILPFRPDLLGDAGRPAIHGGVLATVLDVAGGAAVMSMIGEHDRTSTIDFRVDYLRPGEKRDLFGEARIVRMGTRVAVASALVHHGDPTQPVAEGRLVYDIRRRAAPVSDESNEQA